MKAAIYVCVSTADQHVSRSFTTCGNSPRSGGFEVMKEYQDCGVSGRRARRPGLDSLIVDARQKKFGGRPCGSIRPGREERQALLAGYGRVRCARHYFISRRENVDTSGPMGRLFLTLIGSIAELESDLIRERVLAGMRRAKLEGVRIGRAPLNLDRAAIVRDRITGMTLTAVSKKWGISRSLVCKLVKRSRAGDEGSALPPASVVDSAHVMQRSSAEVGW